MIYGMNLVLKYHRVRKLKLRAMSLKRICTNDLIQPKSRLMKALSLLMFLLVFFISRPSFHPLIY